jgi:SRSO17 transposase
MTEAALEQWQGEFDAFHARLADLFERSESREQARKYLRGLLTEAQRKKSWQVAEAVGDPIPDRMQRLLYRVPWDGDVARDRLQEFVIETFGDPEGIGVVDETGFLKKGTHWVGVGRQSTGTAGQRENSQVATVLPLCDQERPRLPGPRALSAGRLGPGSNPASRGARAAGGGLCHPTAAGHCHADPRLGAGSADAMGHGR